MQIQPYYNRDGITLYCADARKVLPTLSRVDLVVTDPPYGHNNNNDDLIARWELALGKSNGEKPKPRPIANDGPEANDLVRWSFSEFARLLPPGGCCCCCCCGGGGGPDPQFARWSLWLDEVLEFKQMVVWDKGPMGMGWHYRRSYETVLVANKKGKVTWNGGSNTENVIRPGEFGRKIIPTESQHPTAKPVQLMQHFIRLHSNRGELVLDPFAGEGTTLLAAKLEGRRAIGVELSEEYCEKAVNRLRQGVLFG